MLPESIETGTIKESHIIESTVEENKGETILRKSHSIVLYNNHQGLREFNFNKQPKPAEYDLVYENSKGIYLSPRDENSLLIDDQKAQTSTKKRVDED